MTTPLQFLVKFVQQYVGEQRTHRTALWRTLISRLYLCANHHACVELALDERDDCVVLYRALQYHYQFGMVHRVKEALKGDTNRIAVAFTYHRRNTNQCLFRSSIRAETETTLTELAFIDGGQHLGDGLLDHPVHYRGDAKQDASSQPPWVSLPCGQD